MTETTFLPENLVRRLADCPARRKAVLLPLVAWAALAITASLVSCTASTQATGLGTLGQPVELARMEGLIALPGPIRFERVVAADWSINRSGLIDLEHPTALAAGLEDGPEAIEIFFYVLEHPTAGDFIVDSGVAAAFAEEGGSPDVSFLVESVMKTDLLEIHVSTAEWLASRSRPLEGVFLTHIHLDHIMGLPDVPEATPVYVGPGETEQTAFLNLFTRGTIDRMLARESGLLEWPIGSRDDDDAARVLDVFGDGSLFALHVPGHTPGSMAFLARTIDGPKLLVGDTSHTRWGWENDVTPGTFTADRDQNARSLAWLRSLAVAHPTIEIHLGHQRSHDTP